MKKTLFLKMMRKDRIKMIKSVYTKTRNISLLVR